MNAWYIQPQGGTLQRAIIETLNFITEYVYEKVIKSNQTELENSKNYVSNIEHQNIDNVETILDMRYENSVLKEKVMSQLETQIDLKFEVEKLKDKNGG